MRITDKPIAGWSKAHSLVRVAAERSNVRFRDRVLRVARVLQARQDADRAQTYLRIRVQNAIQADLLNRGEILLTVQRTTDRINFVKCS